jgi:hypothetical protein
MMYARKPTATDNDVKNGHVLRSGYAHLRTSVQDVVFGQAQDGAPYARVHGRCVPTNDAIIAYIPQSLLSPQTVAALEGLHELVLGGRLDTVQCPNTAQIVSRLHVGSVIHTA